MRSTIVALGVTLTLFTGACTSQGNANNSDLRVESQPQVDSEQLTTTVELISEAYERIDGAWAGFDPTEHPVVLAWKNNGELIGAAAFNHPSPDQLGTAVKIESDSASLGSAHFVTDLNADVTDRLTALTNFEFDTEIGDARSFLMEADASDEFFDPTAMDYASTPLHEMFHRYQDLQPEAFGSQGSQDVDGYPYTAENLELAALEDRALAAALAADNDDDRVIAARHMAGIRLYRLAAEPRVVLDQDQELNEGSARYIEHLLGAGDTDFTYHDQNYGEELESSPNVAHGVKGTYGFGRFYASGAAVYRLLDLLGQDPDALTESSGKPPTQLLAETLGVTQADAEALVADARAQYDPNDELAALAAEAATMAVDEPNVFDAYSDDSPDPSDGETVGEVLELTDEQVECLEEQLGDTQAEGDEDQVISDEIFELCIG